MGYVATYPYDLPQGSGGLPSVALDSKGNLWAFKRSPAGTAQLYEFGPDHKLIRSIGDDVTVGDGTLIYSGVRVGDRETELVTRTIGVGGQLGSGAEHRTGDKDEGRGVHGDSS